MRQLIYLLEYIGPKWDSTLQIGGRIRLILSERFQQINERQNDKETRIVLTLFVDVKEDPGGDGNYPSESEPYDLRHD